MNEIVHGRIAGRPTQLKRVHVDDSKLGDMLKSCLSFLEYVIKQANEIDVRDAGRETLLRVGFPETVLEVPVRSSPRPEDGPHPGGLHPQRAGIVLPDEPPATRTGSPSSGSQTT